MIVGSSKTIKAGPIKKRRRSSSGSADYARKQREAQYKAFDGWSNIKEVRDLQAQWWDKYVATGENDRSIHELAEQIRKNVNVRYEGDEDGPSNRKEANEIIPQELLKYVENIQIPDFANLDLGNIIPGMGQGGSGEGTNIFWWLVGLVALLVFK